MISVQDVLTHLGIDYPDAMILSNIERKIRVADKYLEGAIGVDYPKDDPRSEELMLAIVGELYDNRSTNVNVASTTRKLIDDFSQQLRLELRLK